MSPKFISIFSYHHIHIMVLFFCCQVNLTEIVAVHGATAHPHFDRDGSYHNLGSLRDTTGPKYAVVKITPDRKGKAHCLKAHALFVHASKASPKTIVWI